MKVLMKKIKKVNLVKRIFYFLSVILYLASLIFITCEAMVFKNTEPILLGIVLALFIIWGLVYLVNGLTSMLSNKKKTFIIMTIVTLLFISIFTVAGAYIHDKVDLFSNANRNKILYTSNLITLKDSKFSTKKPLGMVESGSDIEGNILAKKLIEKEKLKNEIYYYEDYASMIADLYKGKIIGCFVSSNYEIMFSNETFEELEEGVEEVPIGQRVKVIYEYSEERENQDIITLTDSKNKTLTEPFTVLLMGVDSTLDGLKANQAFNGDTLILATFNPNTLTATMFSLPRDLYVPIACNHNRYAKINSSAAYGSSCVINTVQQLTDIKIDYYAKINFTGVVELIDALGGITVDVEEPDFQYNGGINCKGMVCEQNSKRKKGKNMVYIPVGVQKLTGEQALAYARNRHQYALSDISRNQHQQQVIEATARQAKNINSITEFENILETVSNNIETNMSLEQILSFYTVGKDMLLNTTSNSLSIKKTYLAYYNLGVWQPRAERHTSALGYYPGSLEAIKKLMKENLELVKPTPVKTFEVSYNEEYTTPLVGKGITTGERLQLVKSFVGSTEYEASAWCKSVGITCNFQTKTSYQTAGLIYDQSAHKNELVKSLSKITFYISDGKGSKPVVENNTSNETNNNSNTNSSTNTDKENTSNESKEENKKEETSTEDKKEETSTTTEEKTENTTTEPVTDTQTEQTPTTSESTEQTE